MRGSALGHQGKNPFAIPGSIEESRAVFSYLHRNDIDVFQFTLTLEQIGFDPDTGVPTPVVSASALPPACRRTHRRIRSPPCPALACLRRQATSHCRLTRPPAKAWCLRQTHG